MEAFCRSVNTPFRFYITVGYRTRPEWGSPRGLNRLDVSGLRHVRWIWTPPRYLFPSSNVLAYLKTGS